MTTRTPIFFGARWVFWLLLAAPSVLMVSSVCSQKGTAYQFVFPVVVVLACLWEAHVRSLLDHTARGWRIAAPLFLRFVGTTWRLLLWMLLASIPAIILVPQYACYTDRARFTQVLLQGQTLRDTIEARVQASKTLTHAGEGLQVKRSGRLVGGLVTDAGTIYLVSEDPPAVVSLTPQLQDMAQGTLQWKCVGYPARTMPRTCRENMSP
jgi:hypothetical protein